MPLTDQRLGEIAVLAWKHRLVKDGTEIVPSEQARNVKNYAKSLGITVAEAAEFYSLGLDYLYGEANAVLQGLKEKE